MYMKTHIEKDITVNAIMQVVLSFNMFLVQDIMVYPHLDQVDKCFGLTVDEESTYTVGVGLT